MSLLPFQNSGRRRRSTFDLPPLTNFETSSDIQKSSIFQDHSWSRLNKAGQGDEVLTRNGAFQSCEHNSFSKFN